MAINACGFGCPQESINDQCGECGHPKKDHLYIHPHICRGERDKEGIGIVKSCRCSGYIKPNQGKDPYTVRSQQEPADGL